MPRLLGPLVCPRRVLVGTNDGGIDLLGLPVQPAGRIQFGLDGDEELIEQNQALIALLKSWEDDDPEDQRETWAILQETLPRHRFNIPSHLSEE